MKIALIGLIFIGMLVSNCYSQTEEEHQQQAETQQQEEENAEYTMRVNDQDFNLSEEQYNQLLNFFKTYDTNGDGFIDRQEIVQLGKQLNPDNTETADPTEEEITELIGMVDFDKDGKLNFSEFIGLGLMGDEEDYQDDEHVDEGNTTIPSQSVNDDL